MNPILPTRTEMSLSYSKSVLWQQKNKSSLRVYTAKNKWFTTVLCVWHHLPKPNRFLYTRSSCRAKRKRAWRLHSESMTLRAALWYVSTVEAVNLCWFNALHTAKQLTMMVDDAGLCIKGNISHGFGPKHLSELLKQNHLQQQLRILRQLFTGRKPCWTHSILI